MTEHQIQEEVLRYLNDNTYNYAILIDGEWGSGKTFYVKNILSQAIQKHESEDENKAREVKYISLYGCKNVTEVQENIVWSFAEDARKRITRKCDEESIVDKVTRNIMLSSRKIGNAILKKFVSDLSAYEITSDWLNLGTYIFIFDDLERCDCPINELFGFLNELVEHENTKVIIIANEKEVIGIANPKHIEEQYKIALDKRIEWPQKENKNNIYGNVKVDDKVSIDELDRRRLIMFPQKDMNESYKNIREKLIGETLHYSPNLKT